MTRHISLIVSLSIAAGVLCLMAPWLLSFL